MQTQAPTEVEKRIADLQYSLDQLRSACPQRQASIREQRGEPPPREASDGETYQETPPFVVTRPARVDQRRLTGPRDKVYDFASFNTSSPSSRRRRRATRTLRACAPVACRR